MEDIPYGLCAMVEIVGMEKFVEICKLYGGSTVYIPVHSKVTLAERNRQLIKGYNGKISMPLELNMELAINR